MIQLIGIDFLSNFDEVMLYEPAMLSRKYITVTSTEVAVLQVSTSIQNNSKNPGTQAQDDTVYKSINDPSY